MDVSIIIVNWNTKDLLRACLASVFEQTQGIGYEVIVVDNDSSDGSAEMIRAEFPQVRLIANEENRGFAAANNQGIAIAQGRYVLLLNSDTVVIDDVIPECVGFADEHRDAAVVGCRVLSPDRTLQPTCFMFPSLLNMLLSSTYLYKVFPKSRFFGREEMTWWDRSDVREVDVVTGCFMLVRREAIERVGPMDERFFMYGEETDWCYRFKEDGWNVLFAPVGNIVHYGGQSSRLRRARMKMQLCGSILIFFRKHRSLPEFWTARFLSALFLFLRVPYWLLVSLFSAKRRKITLETAWTYFVGGVYCLASWRRLLVYRNPVDHPA